LGNQTYALDE